MLRNYLHVRAHWPTLSLLPVRYGNLKSVPALLLLFSGYLSF